MELEKLIDGKVHQVSLEGLARDFLEMHFGADWAMKLAASHGSFAGAAGIRTTGYI